MEVLSPLLPGSLCLVLVTTYTALSVTAVQDSIIVETINGIDEGNIALFQCLRRDNRKPANVRRWLFGGRKLPMAKTGRIFVKESATNHQLYIKDARTSDSGKYTCVAHIQGRMVNASNYLSVSCPIRTSPMPVTRAVLGGPATLKCDGECYDHILWTRENGTIIDSPVSVPREAKGSIFKIRNVTVADNGTYVCEFFNGGRIRGRATQRVELLISIPVDNVNISNSSLEQKVGQNLEITCQANGTPRPKSVKWLNNSRLIEPSKRVTSVYNPVTGVAKLKIHPLTQYDSATITCRYIQELLPNKFHSFDAKTELAVTGKPNPPSNLRIMDVFVTQQKTMNVRLRWNHPEYKGGLHMLAYRISYWDEISCRLARENCSQGEQWRGASGLSCVYHGVATRAVMCFSVQSVNSDGLSIASATVCTHPVRIESLPTMETSTTQISTMHSSTAVPVVSTHTPSKPVTSTPQVMEKRFQVVLQNTEELCSQSLQVSKATLTSTLARHFTRLAKIPITVHDLTAKTMVSLGGIIYYQAVLAKPHAEVILSRISHYIEKGKEQLFISGSHLDFRHLQSCPFEIKPDTPSCVFNSVDADLFSCHIASTERRTNCSSNSLIPPDLAVILVFILGGILVFLIPFSLILCYQMKQLQQKRHNVRITNTCKDPSVCDINGGQQLKSENPSLGRRGTVDSAVSGMSKGSSRVSSGSVGDDVFPGD